MAIRYSKVWHDEKVAKLLEAMLQEAIVEVKPELDSQSEMGFCFPSMTQLLNTTGKESTAILESLASEGILVRKFFDKFLRCPQCQSMQLRPLYYCPKCSSGNIIRGRVLEHLSCKYAGIEDEFVLGGKLVCPGCKEELHTVGIDYRSMGMLYQCCDCRETSNFPSIKWRCLKCASPIAADKVSEVNAYSYTLDPEKRNWLGFELKPKSQLMQFLQDRGYDVEENAKVEGRSGAEHNFDMLATRALGILTHRAAIGIEIAPKEIELDRIFDFDDRAYDCGIYYKVLIGIPGFAPEAERFAARQRIRVLDLTALEGVLASATRSSPVKEIPAEAKEEPFQLKSKADMVDYLRSRGYEAKQNSKIRGESGVEHSFDILATRDDGILVHNIAIGFEVAQEPIEIGKVVAFDHKAYDCGIPDKVLLAIPRLTEEGSRFAQRQRINVFEAEALEPKEKAMALQARGGNSPEQSAG